MCGITGFWNQFDCLKTHELQNRIARMADTISHRGPDDYGEWCDPHAGIALGFRRLSILDLSPAGHQPMVSADGKYVIVYNGEVYNFSILRSELLSLGHKFKGHSDTEIMLAAICQWGIMTALRRFNGMFAIALWNRDSRQLHLIRDRLGIKPLYYGWAGKTLIFGSELKSIRSHPAFQPEINRDALALYLRHNYIPTPHTIYKDFYKLVPGSILTINENERPGEYELVPYWSAKNIVEDGLTQSFIEDETEAVEMLEKHLRNSIKLRMIADVPLGAFLSGGVDSSTVVALMQDQSNRPIKTFTIGFKETGFDEAKNARTIAKHLGTEHTELYVTSEQARAVIPMLPTLYDEPFADSSQIPTYLVAKLARQHVTVSLSGDGGDELFAGYNRYFWTTRIWRNIGWIPLGIRNLAAEAIRAISPATWTNAIMNMGKILPGMRNFPNAGDKAHKFSDILAAKDPENIYYDFVSHWKNPTEIVLGAKESNTILTDSTLWPVTNSIIERMMYLDLITYMPDDILVKVDRASMGVSLEARVPFIDDHETVEFAWKLPLRMKLRNGQGKWILRQVLYKYIPREMIERPKMGFGVPIDSWLRGPLFEWAESLLDTRRLQQEGFFDPQQIQQKWKEHTSGNRNWQYLIWGVLMFQAWLEVNS